MTGYLFDKSVKGCAKLCGKVVHQFRANDHLHCGLRLDRTNFGGLKNSKILTTHDCLNF